MPDVWNWIEDKAFNPKTEEEKNRWLSCFHKFLPKIWEVQHDWKWWAPIKNANSWCSDKMCGENPLRPLRDAKVGFSYDIKYSGSQFSVRLFFSCNSFQVEYDNNHVFEFTKQISNKINNDAITYEKIEKSIKNRIKHPALHTHIESKDFSHHNLRFGFATCNPFVMLYQVAFQLIDYKNKRKSEMREKEISRITEIIHTNKNRPQISAGVLLKK